MNSANCIRKFHIQLFYECGNIHSKFYTTDYIWTCKSDVVSKMLRRNTNLHCTKSSINFFT